MKKEVLFTLLILSILLVSGINGCAKVEISPYDICVQSWNDRALNAKAPFDYAPKDVIIGFKKNVTENEVRVIIDSYGFSIKSVRNLETIGKVSIRVEVPEGTEIETVCTVCKDYTNGGIDESVCNSDEPKLDYAELNFIAYAA